MAGFLEILHRTRLRILGEVAGYLVEVPYGLFFTFIHEPEVGDLQPHDGAASRIKYHDGHQDELTVDLHLEEGLLFVDRSACFLPVQKGQANAQAKYHCQPTSSTVAACDGAENNKHGEGFTTCESNTTSKRQLLTKP